MRIVFKDGSGEYDIDTEMNDYYRFTRADGSRGKALKAMEGIDYDVKLPSGEVSLPEPVSANVENTVFSGGDPVVPYPENLLGHDPDHVISEEEARATLVATLESEKMSEEELEELTKPDESKKESE